jgi:hypothetical protein
MVSAGFGHERTMMTSSLKTLLTLVAVLVGLSQNPAAAATLPEPEGEVMLTLSGAITGSNDPDGTVQFDLAMLLSRLLTAVGATGAGLHAVALNDYAVEIPASDAVEGGPIVAFAMNGAPMSVRDKGPLWIIYPFDAKPEYQSEVIYSRSIWQLDRIVITP